MLCACAQVVVVLTSWIECISDAEQFSTEAFFLGYITSGPNAEYKHKGSNILAIYYGSVY